MVGKVGAGGGPSQCRAQRNGPVQVVHVDDPVENQVDALAPDRRSNSPYHTPQHRLLDHDGNATESAQPTFDYLSEGAVGFGSLDDLYQRNKLGRIEWVDYKATVLAYCASRKVLDCQRGRGTRYHPRIRSYAFEGLDQLLFCAKVLCDCFDDPLSAATRLQQAPSNVELLITSFN